MCVSVPKCTIERLPTYTDTQYKHSTRVTDKKTYNYNSHRQKETQYKHTTWGHWQKDTQACDKSYKQKNMRRENDWSSFIKCLEHLVGGVVFDGGTKQKQHFAFSAFESEDHSPLLQCAISQQDNNYFLNKITASYTKMFSAKKKIDLQTRLTFPVKLDTSRQWYWAARSCKTKKQLHRSAVWQMATQPQNISFPLSLPTTRSGGTRWPLVRFCLLFLPPHNVFHCLTFK